MFRAFKRFLKGSLYGVVGAAILGAMFGVGGVIVGFFAGLYIGYPPKPKYSSSNHYSVTEDPNMTLWENRYCSSCNQSTPHKISRVSEGSKDAFARCNVCRTSYDCDW